MVDFEFRTNVHRSRPVLFDHCLIPWKLDLNGNYVFDIKIVFNFNVHVI